MQTALWHPQASSWRSLLLPVPPLFCCYCCCCSQLVLCPAAPAAVQLLQHNPT
jgi:hypothetical protein